MSLRIEDPHYSFMSPRPPMGQTAPHPTPSKFIINNNNSLKVHY